MASPNLTSDGVLALA